ncbi:hypothetical protein B0I33_105222 [Prauserella shujinwangii]|uniref:Uncharacterized protein n=1 Tax=Prauserella shujinwangii TaxID=1453103 RepID=A0A2T0LUX4_9PSEU|nr:hypothetical protein [Prauserella shujinwangii]PRX47642.1 hypothetical protein B0I33_105222 [Prauserella shujinwangii]
MGPNGERIAELGRPDDTPIESPAVVKSVAIIWSVISYSQVLRVLQPVVPVLFDSVTEGVALAAREHGERGYKRQHDPHYYAATARREVMERLNKAGLMVLHEDGDRPLLPMSALLLAYDRLSLWMFKASRREAGGAAHEIPLPGRSVRKQKYWRQEPVLPLDGLPADNILLLWSEDRGVLYPTMTLVRPLAGDHRVDSLRIDWAGPLQREMATFSAADLDELRPAEEHLRLGEADER